VTSVPGQIECLNMVISALKLPKGQYPKGTILLKEQIAKGEWFGSVSSKRG